jgi:hypothetical protein
MRTATAARQETHPLIAVIYTVPLLEEAMLAAVGDVTTVRSFPAGRDTVGLLSWLRPDGVVVDSDEEAENATPFARERGVPLVHVSFARRKVHVLRDGEWDEPEDITAAPETVRNIIVGGIFGAGRAR